MEARSRQSRVRCLWIEHTYGHGPVSVFLKTLLLGGVHDSSPLAWEVLFESISKIHGSMIVEAERKEDK
jgi:hypothetical protein